MSEWFLPHIGANQEKGPGKVPNTGDGKKPMFWSSRPKGDLEEVGSYAGGRGEIAKEVEGGIPTPGCVQRLGGRGGRGGGESASESFVVFPSSDAFSAS